MSDTSKSLRKAADEIENEGHLGWGNTCRWAADEFDAITSRLAEAERQMSDARVLIAVGDYSSAAARLAPKAADSAPAAEEGMTLAPGLAPALGQLMREQQANRSRAGAYPDGNPNAGLTPPRASDSAVEVQK